VNPSDSGTAVVAGSEFLSEQAQLEKERRKHQKRLRPEPTLDGEDSEDDMGVRECPAKRQHLSSSSVHADNARTRLTSTPSTLNVPTLDRVFWDGEFHQTATQHADPRKDGRPTFRIMEVLAQVSVYSRLKSLFSCPSCIPHFIQKSDLWISRGYTNCLIVPFL
jgi:tyrosyl-DNA phosphodiesterase 1